MGGIAGLCVNGEAGSGNILFGSTQVGKKYIFLFPSMYVISDFFLFGTFWSDFDPLPSMPPPNAVH